MSDRWSRAVDLYQAALQHDAKHRQAFLDERCGGDETLRRDVESLLAEGVDGFLSTPAVDMLAMQIAQDGRETLLGCRVGPYRIESSIGSGGMGEVYRAHDTTLGRDVAIKVLPAAFSADPERAARFDQEARLLAVLNHPHIAAIYGVAPLEAGRALVLELVEGETLGDRLSSRTMAVDESIGIARQIALALEAAHDKGIVHRDLKPGNIKITPAGVVKVLDFGLAKMVDGDGSRAATLAVVGTHPGVILGTPAYMSPEQARGKTVDRRTDIWAFGCVLFEMLAGRRPFEGDTTSDTLAAVLEHDPDWRIVSPATPPGIRRLLQRTLEKDPDKRLDDIREARAELDAAQVQQPARFGIRSIAAAGLLAAAIVSGVVVVQRTRPRAEVVSPSEYVQLTNVTDAAMAPALSPDGRMLVFKRGTNTGQAGGVEDFLGAGEIYIKLLPNGDSLRLTDAPGRKFAPVFTPDGSRVTYSQLDSGGSQLAWDTWSVPVLGGRPTRLLPNATGLTWISAHRVLFSEISSGLHMGIVTATDTRAESRRIYFPALELGMAHYSYLSPDGRWVLIIEMANTHAFDSPCRLVPFDGTSAGRQVGPAGTCLSAAWSPDGRWMYFAADVDGNVHLWRQRFPSGTPEQITFGTSQEQGLAIAPDGRSLVTSIGQRLSTVWIHDATGERPITSEGYASTAMLTADGSRAFYIDSGPAFNVAGPAAPGELRVVDVASGRSEAVLPGATIADYDVADDGTEVAFSTRGANGATSIWLAPLDRRSPPRRLTDGDQVSYGSGSTLFFRLAENGVNHLYRIDRDGGHRALVTRDPILIKYDASPDNRWVTAFVPGSSAASPSTATVAIPVEGGDARRICVATCPAAWSHDGRFFLLDGGARTWIVPVAPGALLPPLPPAGLTAATKADAIPGAVIVPRGGASVGPTASTFVFSRTELHANLFRIPLH